MKDRTYYSGPHVCSLAGITYRQLDYWCRVGLLYPKRPARGSGSRRAFDRRGIQIAWALGQLTTLDVGGGRGLPDLSVLLASGAWDGWLVITPGQRTQHVTEPALLGALLRAPASIVLDLTACPMLDPDREEVLAS